MSATPINPIAAALRVQIVGAAETELMATVGAILESGAAAREAPAGAAVRTPPEAPVANGVADPAGTTVQAPRATQAPTPAGASAPPYPAQRAADTARADAAGRQAGAAPLFAELAQALQAPATPPTVKAAISQVLALQTPAAGPFTAESVRQAVAQSGLFLEAHLAALPRGAPVPPDLKAALLTLRQAVGAAEPAPPPPAATQATIQAAVSRVLAAQTPAGTAPTSPAASPAVSPAAPAAAGAVPAESLRRAVAQPERFLQASLAALPRGAMAAPELKAALVALRQALEPTDPASPPATPAQIKAAVGRVLTLQAPVASPGAGPAAGLATTFAATPAATQTTAEALRQALSQPRLFLEAALPRSQAAPPELNAALAALQHTLNGPEPAPTPRTSTPPPPPPSREAALTAQAVATATLSASADAPTILSHLGREAEQAIARQVLHQLASLPDAAAGGWMFELPIATPQGAAVAQFEVERDGARHADEEPGWRVRFSLDIEPLGPVHVHLSAKAGHAAVTVWAEREATLERLRQEGAALAQALPGDVAFHPGAPIRPAPAPGGFVDRSL